MDDKAFKDLTLAKTVGSRSF